MQKIKFLEAYEINSSFYGDEHPIIASNLNNLGLISFVEGDYQDAKDKIMKSLEITLKNFGFVHKDNARGFINLGRINANLGFFPESEKNLNQAKEIFEQLFGINDLRTQNVLKIIEIVRRKEKY